ncbi:hypothetical protein ACO0M4_29060 [Streptomyces sp. RGM 3693]|uniref:hypothetical protein n=1 Tax=Streptomyces sp. RGM 3693 TaxID=3413284 RepID=UPI003D26D8CB
MSVRSLPRRVITRLQARFLQLLDRRERDAGLETLEKLIIGAVLITAATAFALAFKGKFDSLLSNFKSAF